MARKRRIAGAAAGCAVALASMMGTASVGAQDACIECPETQTPGQIISSYQGVDGAFWKVGQSGVFPKVEGPAPAFLKIGIVSKVELYPGNTLDVFHKVEDPK